MYFLYFLRFKLVLLTISLFLILLCLPRNIDCRTDVTVGYPAMAMQYKMFIEARKEDCIFQYTYAGAVFNVDLQVIRGGDGTARFAVKDPHGITVLPYQFTKEASYQTQNATAGYYVICVDNDSKFTTKLISIFMATYEAEGWNRFISDLAELGETGRNFSKTFNVVSQGISEILQHIHQSKSQEARDFALLLENNFNVGFWSFVQCLIIFVSGSLHVYTIRQFFYEAPSRGKYKVRL